MRDRYILKPLCKFVNLRKRKGRPDNFDNLRGKLHVQVIKSSPFSFDIRMQIGEIPIKGNILPKCCDVYSTDERCHSIEFDNIKKSRGVVKVLNTDERGWKTIRDNIEFLIEKLSLIPLGPIIIYMSEYLQKELHIKNVGYSIIEEKSTETTIPFETEIETKEENMKKREPIIEQIEAACTCETEKKTLSAKEGETPEAPQMQIQMSIVNNRLDFKNLLADKLIGYIQLNTSDIDPKKFGKWYWWVKRGMFGYHTSLEYAIQSCKKEIENLMDDFGFKTDFV